VAYVESWKAIELANSIFGFDGWSSQIVDITPDFIEEIPGPKFRVGVTAVVKVMLKDGTFHEDVGYGINVDKSKGNAIENAKKEAVSDARKRALRVFGNALGNCVYDKEHVKKIKSQLKGAATSTISYDKLRAGMSNNSQNFTISPQQPQEYVATSPDDIEQDGIPGGNTDGNMDGTVGNEFQNRVNGYSNLPSATVNGYSNLPSQTNSGARGGPVFDSGVGQHGQTGSGRPTW